MDSDVKAGLVRFLLTPSELYARIVMFLVGGRGGFFYASQDRLIPAPDLRLATSTDLRSVQIRMGPFYVEMPLSAVESFTDTLIRVRDKMREADAEREAPHQTPKAAATNDDHEES